MGSHNDVRGWDPIGIDEVAIRDLPRPSTVRHSANAVVCGGDAVSDAVADADDDEAAASEAAMRRHSALCSG